MLHHCAAGRDRTGIGATYIYLALGVPRETIIADYLLSNELLAPIYAQMRSMLAEAADGETLERAMAMMTLRRELLEAVFDEIDRRYGGDGAFLEAQFGLSPSRLAALRDACLE